MMVLRSGVARALGLVSAFGAGLGLSGVALGQVQVAGFYETEVRLTVQGDLGNPDDPGSVLLSRAEVDARFVAETLVTLAEEPTAANPGVAVLDVRVKNLKMVLLDDLVLEFFPAPLLPPLLRVDGEDLEIELRDDGTADFDNAEFGAGFATIEYGDLDARALGEFTIDSLFTGPETFEVDSFNPFVTDVPTISFELDVIDGEVVQVINLVSDFTFFQTEVLGLEFSLVVFPTFVGDDFTMVSPVTPVCDPVAHPLGDFGGAGRLTPLEFSSRGASVADVNNDGAPDVVVLLNTFGGSDSVTTVMNRGDGTLDDFVLPEFAPVDRSATALTTADFNGDGLVDAAVCGSADDGLETLFGNGDGTFTVSQKIEDTTNSANHVVAGDLNGDGSPDLLNVSLLDNRLDVFMNDGTGQFALAQSVATQFSPRRVVLTDLDGDGSLDAAVSGGFTGFVDLFLNNGAGTLAAAGSAVVGDQPNVIASGDLDGDGDVDLVTANLVDDTVTVLLNDGVGGFGAGVPIAVGESPNSLLVVDVDLDGDLDLVVSANDEDAIEVLDNDGTGSFAPPVTFVGVINPGNLTFGDLDQDGDPDLVAVQFSFSGDNGVRTFINGCTGEGSVGCSVADVAEPFGVLDIDDVLTFLAAFSQGDGLADVAPPAGALDIDDVLTFLVAFSDGCP